MLFEELLLLKEFEKRENFLQEALSSKLSDRDEMSDKVRKLIAIRPALILRHTLNKFRNIIEYGIIGEGSQIWTNQERESTVFSLLIGDQSLVEI